MKFKQSTIYISISSEEETERDVAQKFFASFIVPFILFFEKKNVYFLHTLILP